MRGLTSPWDALPSLTLTALSLLPSAAAQHVGHSASDWCSIKSAFGPIAVTRQDVREA